MRVAKYSSEEKMVFGKNLKVYMEEHQIKSVDLATALHISPPRMSAALKGDVSDDNMEMIAEYLNVPLSDFLKETTEEEPTMEAAHTLRQFRQGKVASVIFWLVSMLLFVVLWVYGRLNVCIWEDLSPLAENGVDSGLLDGLRECTKYRDIANLLSVAVACGGSILFFTMGYGKLVILWDVLSMGIMLLVGYGWAIQYYLMSGDWWLGNFLEPTMLYGFWWLLILFVGLINRKKWKKESWPNGKGAFRLGVSVLLAFVLVFGVQIGWDAIQRNQKSVKIEGISLSQEDFSWVFTGDPETAKTLDDCEVGRPKLKLSEIQVEGDSFGMLVSLNTGDENERFKVEGTLRTSFMSEKYNNAVVEVEKGSEKYEILHIQICNSTEYGNPFVREELEGERFLGVYMRDDSKTIYLFETELPESLWGIQGLDYEKGPGKWDVVQWITQEMFQSK